MSAIKVCPRANQRAPRRGERGTALLELALAVPLLLFLAFAVIVLTHYFNWRSMISVVAYEGARFGAGLEQLEMGSNGPLSDGTRPVHDRLRQRIDDLLSRQGINPMDASVVTTRIQTTAAGDTVTVTIVAPYFRVMVFPSMRSSVFGRLTFPTLDRVSVRAMAPYLHAQAVPTPNPNGGGG